MRWPSLDAWARGQSPTALLVVRLLLVSNGAVLSAVGALCFAFVAPPAGIVAGTLVWLVTGALLCVVPYTNPRRGQNGRW